MIDLDRIDPDQVEDRASLAVELELESLASDGRWAEYFATRAEYYE